MKITYDPAKRQAAIENRGLNFADAFAALFPSPLAGEGGSAKRRRVRGCLNGVLCWTTPLTQPSLCLPAVMPSPAGGEGVAIGTAMRGVFKCNDREKAIYQKRFDQG